MATKNNLEIFSGREDVNKFVTKCDLQCTLKAYKDEMKAVLIAGKLEGAAFDVYMGTGSK